MHFTRRQFLYGTTAATRRSRSSPRAFAQQAGSRAASTRRCGAPVERGDVVGVVGAITNAEDTIYSAAPSASGSSAATWR